MSSESNREHQPGTFWNAESEPDFKDEDPYLMPPSDREGAEVKELTPEVRDDLVEKYKIFAKILNETPQVIYHPSNDTDISPSEAFPNSRVIYVEINKKSVEALKKAGYEAHYASAAEPIPGHPEIPVYTPDKPVDVLILLNPAISSKVPSQSVKEGGYVIANDYHSNATEFKNDPDFELVGIIRGDSKSKGYILDTDHPEDYWKEIETEEEFKAAPFSWGGTSYEEARQVVAVLTGKNENILEEYKKIIEQVKSNERQEFESKWADRELEFPKYLERLKGYGTNIDAMSQAELEKTRQEFYEGIRRDYDPSHKTEFIVNHNGRTIFISTDLPRKKDTVDDQFVFKKIKAT